MATKPWKRAALKLPVYRTVTPPPFIGCRYFCPNWIASLITDFFWNRVTHRQLEDTIRNVGYDRVFPRSNRIFNSNTRIFLVLLWKIYDVHTHAHAHTHTLLQNIGHIRCQAYIMLSQHVMLLTPATERRFKNSSACEIWTVYDCVSDAPGVCG